MIIITLAVIPVIGSLCGAAVGGFSGVSLRYLRFMISSLLFPVIGFVSHLFLLRRILLVFVRCGALFFEFD